MPAGMHKGARAPLMRYCSNSPQSGARGKRRASAKALFIILSPDGEKVKGKNCMKYGGIIAKQRAHVLY